MRWALRAFSIVRERASVVVVGSAFWWFFEHLADEGISHIVQSVSACVK